MADLKTRTRHRGPSESARGNHTPGGELGNYFHLIGSFAGFTFLHARARARANTSARVCIAVERLTSSLAIIFLSAAPPEGERRTRALLALMPSSFFLSPSQPPVDFRHAGGIVLELESDTPPLINYV